MATHMAMGYCNIRIRIYYKSSVHDFHLLSIPVYDRKPAIFNTLTKAMDVLYTNWRDTIIGASSDGEKKMTERHLGIIKRIQRVARPWFMQVWCDTKQLDLCM